MSLEEISLLLTSLITTIGGYIWIVLNLRELDLI